MDAMGEIPKGAGPEETHGGSEPEVRRGRGRPTEVERREPGEGLSLARPLASQSTTTTAILRAGERLLRDKGPAALTIESVAREAHVDTTTVFYHFGSKAGLLESLFDALSHDALASFAASVAETESVQERIELYWRYIGLLMRQDEGNTRSYHELLLHTLRNAHFRERVALLNDWYLSQIGTLIVGDAGAAVGLDRDVRAALWFMYSLVAGIELNNAVDPERFPFDEVFRLANMAIVDVIQTALAASSEPPLETPSE